MRRIIHRHEDRLPRSRQFTLSHLTHRFTNRSTCGRAHRCSSLSGLAPDLLSRPLQAGQNSSSTVQSPRLCRMEIECTRDGSCVHDYSCDPTRSRSVHRRCLRRHRLEGNAKYHTELGTARRFATTAANTPRPNTATGSRTVSVADSHRIEHLRFQATKWRGGEGIRAMSRAAHLNGGYRVVTDSLPATQSR